MENQSTVNRFSDEELVKMLPGFTNEFAAVNGINLHYVTGGEGTPIILLPGWPETWWAYHKIMPVLSFQHRVIAVDLRGMGSSDKPEDGFDKKNMAKDIFELTKVLGFDNVTIAGHDIGADVAFSFAANFPEATDKLIILDTPHPDENMFKLPMLPMGPVTHKAEGSFAYPWWVAFNQVKALPEQILEGRMNFLIDWVFNYLLADESVVSVFDRAVYTQAYDNKESIRASNGWYQAFPQDIKDSKTYSKLEMPVLGIAGGGIDMLKAFLEAHTADLRMEKAEKSGHFLLAEQPEEVAAFIADFLS